MALNTQIADATVNAQAAALATLCNSGLIKIYDGTQPATADTALGAQVLGVTTSLPRKPNRSFWKTCLGALVRSSWTRDSQACRVPRLMCQGACRWPI